MLCGRVKEVCLEGGQFSDVLFQLEDGTTAVHRPLLMARCDMMHAMFSGDFRESNAKVVSHSIVCCECIKYYIDKLKERFYSSLKELVTFRVIATHWVH